MKNVIKNITLAIIVSLSAITTEAKVHTPDHYDFAIRQCFRDATEAEAAGHKELAEERWTAGKYMLDEIHKQVPAYEELSNIRELNGWYYYHVKDYNTARRWLHNALEEDNSNTHARELMVKVEEETQNYSSAICYTNELLESDPYSRGLWKNQIKYYRLLNNDAFADDLLDRLYEIYPNDSTIHNDVAYRYEEKIIKQKERGDISGQIKSAETLIGLQPDNTDNYLILTNLYLQQGRTEDAIRISGVGAKATTNQALIRKHVGILCGQGRHQAALSYLAELPKSAMVNQLISEVQEEQARYANANDPYTAYGRVYERTHNKESFNYLINTSISRGYYNDALYYVKDYVKRNEETEDILYKEYVIYKELGNEAQATYALLKLYKKNPNDTDICDELSSIYYRQGIEYMRIEEYASAIEPLEFVANECNDTDMRNSAINRLSTCYLELKRYDEALSQLNPSDSLYSLKRGNLLAKMGKYPEALIVLREANDSIAYGEVAVPYIKKLMDRRMYQEAFNNVDTSLVYCHDKELYMYGISSGNILHKDVTHYIDEGIQRYPFEDYFINQYAGLSNTRALNARKDKDYETAMSYVEDGLFYSPSNMELLYTKGLIFENMHQYDSAYVYQKYYKPSSDEAFGHNKKLDGFRSRGFKNTITIDYQRARLGAQDVVTANAGISYARQINDRNTIEVMFNYAGRDDAITDDELLTQQTPGGVGVQIGVGLSHRFDKEWTAAISGAWSNKYYPSISAKASVSKEFDNGLTLEAHGQYKKIDAYNKVGNFGKFDHWEHTQPNLWDAGVSMNMPFGDHFDVNLSGDAVFIHNKAYYNVGSKIQYSPFVGSKTRVYATGGVGTAPEITLIDNSMPNSFEKINTHVGMGGIYSVSANLDLGLEGNWHTMYKQTQTLATGMEQTLYVNLFYVHAQMFIKF